MNTENLDAHWHTHILTHVGTGTHISC
jgi:hypothetical protein